MREHFAIEKDVGLCYGEQGRVLKWKTLKDLDLDLDLDLDNIETLSQITRENLNNEYRKTLMTFQRQKK